MTIRVTIGRVRGGEIGRAWSPTGGGETVMLWIRDLSQVALTTVAVALVGGAFTGISVEAVAEHEPLASADNPLSSRSVDDLEQALSPLLVQPQAATISLSGAQGNEGETLRFVLRITGDFGGTMTGLILTSGKGEDFRDGGEPTATRDIDYFHYRRTVSFSGPEELEIYVPTYDDDEVESDEWFMMMFFCDNCEPHVDLRTRGWIADDDSAVTSSLSVGDVSVGEGDAGSTVANFTVSLAPASASIVTVDYSTCGVGCDSVATATGGDDYQDAVDSLTFLPGETSKTVPVTIYGDTAVEPDEVFFMYLGDATAAAIADHQGRGTIVNDDTDAVDPFIDDDDSVFEADIEWMAAEGITMGCNPPLNDRFCPDANVTRAQMAAFLVRALDLTDRLADPFFDDDGSIFEADIERLAAAGITKGCNPPANDRFCPDRKVTREQMAAFLVRALGYSDNGGGDLFVDDNDSIFEADIDRLGAAGVTKGCNSPINDRYCPMDNVTRGQMAAFLHRALD